MQNHAIADALLKTQQGKVLVVEARKVVGIRFRELDEVAYQTWVKHAPKEHGNHYGLYKAASARIRELAAQGGEDYRMALSLLKTAWLSREDFESAAGWLTNSLQRRDLGYQF